MAHVALDFLAAADQRPDWIALQWSGGPVTAGQLAEEVRRVAANLAAAGIAAGDRVGVMLPNVPPFVAAHLGILLRGAVFVPFNVLLQPPEIAFQINDSRLAALVVHQTFLPQVEAALRHALHAPRIYVLGQDPGGHTPWQALVQPPPRTFEPPAVAPQQPIEVLYTSGTTGRPKGAQITHANLAAMLGMFDGALPLDEGDTFLCVLPLFHVFALNGLLHPALRKRATVLLHPRFEVESCVDSLEHGGVTHFAGVPTMYFYLLKHPRIDALRFPHLRHCISGGAAMPGEVLRQFEQRFAVRICEGYGLTETTVCVCLNRPHRRRLGSVGPPLEGVELRIVDDLGRQVPDGELGEVAVRGPNVMLGYLNQPGETRRALRDGWFFTGDIGYRDAEGFVFLVDRKKDMILKGGFNVYPREVEEVLHQLPEVAEAAVFGVADEGLGEQIAAAVAPRPGHTLAPEQLHAHLAARLARYKLPAWYVLLPELPKGPTGKLLKRQLREQWETLPRQPAPRRR